MKSKKTLIILVIIFAAILIGGGIAYKTLSERAAADAAKAREAAAGQESAAAISDMPQEEYSEDSPDEETQSASAAVTQEPEEEAAAEEIPETQREYAKNFEFESLDGIKAALNDFTGRPIIVNFWATWCPPCKAELPYFQEAYNEYGDDVQFFMVALVDGYQETRSMVAEFLDETGYNFPVFMDTTGSAVNAYEIYSIPRTIAINGEGEIIADYSGAMSEDTLAGVLNELIQ